MNATGENGRILKAPRKKSKISCSIEVRTDRLSRNVGKELPPYAVQHPSRAQILCLINYGQKLR